MLWGTYFCICFLAVVRMSSEKRVPFQMSEHKQESTQSILDSQTEPLPAISEQQSPVCQWSSAKTDTETSLNHGV